MKSIEALRIIQKEIEVPKSHYNDFGKYSYRTAEDILAAVKKIIAKHDLHAVVLCNDELESRLDRIYVKATAIIMTEKDSLSTIAYAREQETKKKMDASQITGAASSYARKYALNGLLGLNDVKDADAQKPINETDADNKSTVPQTITQIKQDKLKKLIQKTNTDMIRFQAYIDSLVGKVGCNFKDIPIAHYQTILNILEKKLEAENNVEDH